MSSPTTPLPPFPLCVECARLDWQDGMPVARDFDDPYFSRAGGVAETQHVFIDGNDLRARFSAGGFHVFVIGETGFGTGLNFLVAAHEFLAHAPADATLHYVSVEKFPLAPGDLARAQAHWPEFAVLAGELQAAYPPACTGFHRRELAGGRVRLTLLYGDAAALLPRLDAIVDAWFLDGFAPAKNADLWTPELFGELARLSAGGTTFATFTAAGHVRRGLVAAGFAVEKVRGFGSKRDMLRGTFNAAVPAARPQRGHAAVIGGGLAGCAAARALAERGWQVTLFERNAQLADETSGNLAGAVYPKFSVHETPQNRWYRDSYLYALARLPRVLGAPDGMAWDRGGLLQMPDTEGPDLAAIAATGRWPSEVLRSAEAEETPALTGLALEHGGLWFPGAAWVHPPALCRALVDHPRIALRTGVAVRELTHDGTRTHIDGRPFDAVVVAGALDSAAFAPTATLPLRRVRGQVTHVAATTASRALHAVVCHDGYVTPARQVDGQDVPQHCVGATFGPRDRDPAVRADDHARNLATLGAASPALHAALGGDDAVVTGGRTGFRAQTPDYLPLIGAVPDATAFAARPEDPVPPAFAGLHVLAALGAKGIAFSLLGAEIIAARLGGEPLPVDREVAAALDPGRFLFRTRRREMPRGRQTEY